jgi:hypothetical protein
MQCTANIHRHVVSSCVLQPDELFEYATAFDVDVDTCDVHALPSKLTITRFWTRVSTFPRGFFIG